MIKLSDDEKVVIAALVASPAWKLLKKIMDAEEQSALGMLATAGDVDAIRQFQGRVAGIRTITRVPEFAARIHNREKAERKKKAEKKLRS